ncbi:hypothetical protein Q31b_22280 [Novipirellula aureliae]|uniref:Uncharacterized protein n=1 Tax=Novipirellula aureliae TaxID=2527966 RepID=A0A5C6E2Q3_9BACT|nr:hypothetical protein [Novipirellula aureliae]TWU43190.1 hypothetical protein Q31b_22280 [Novipirellula aureliae]
MSESKSADPEAAHTVADDPGPGWLPAILAATMLMAIVGFITCGVSTYFLFQKRGELAVRTLDGNLIPTIEQSRIEPDQKAELVERLKEFSAEIARGNVENWQAAGVMQRLQRIPIYQWGELSAVEAFARSNWEGEEQANALKQISRLRRSVELAQSTVFDVEDVLTPVHQTDDGAYGRSLITPLTTKAVADVVKRATLVADRSEVPDEPFETIRIDVIVQREIEKGIAEGSY